MITTTMPAALDNPQERERTADELIDSLVELHSVDWTKLGLEGFGKPTGYLERQLRRFNGLWEHNKTREIPEFEQVGQLAARQHPAVAAGDDRPWRLPSRQHDLRPRRAGPADRRSSTGRWRRSETRSPTSAT